VRRSRPRRCRLRRLRRPWRGASPWRWPCCVEGTR
jgi:hypothetical protein